MVAETAVTSSGISSSGGDESGCDRACRSCCLFGSKTPSVAPAVIDDALLAKELNGLSFEERERIFDDIHGVADIVQERETPEFIRSHIKKLDEALSLLPRTKRPTLERAMFLKPSLEGDVKFKLMFLRVDGYDAARAARRMAKYFEDKAKLFGEDKLVKEITLDDFDEEDMKVFRSGPYISIPQRDAVGRPIWLGNIPKYDFNYPKSLTRCAWYMIMTALREDEVSQIKGVCNILYCPSSGWKFNAPVSQFLDMMITGGDMIGNLPARVTSVHFCYDSAGLEFVLSGFRKAFGKDYRLRLRAHYGSGVEIQYKLLTYGIKLPHLLEDTTDHNGRDDKMEVHHKFIQARLQQEREERLQEEKLYQATININNRSSSKSNSLLIPYPKPNDVLVGRGSPYQTYSGNINLNKVVESQFLDRYSQATEKFEKTCIHMDVVKKIQEEIGGRFIERTSEGWKVVDDRVARKKVNSSFRSKMARYPSSKHDSQIMTAVENHGKKNNTFFRTALNGGSAKRARYDPNILTESNCGSHHC